jgi:hypothetical protein
MTNYEEIIQALTIFRKYFVEGQYESIAAEHDEIYAGPNPEIVSEEDKAILKELGWNDYGTGSFHRFV